MKERIVANTIEKRLLNERGQPNFNVILYIVNVKGDYAGVALYGSSESGPVRFAACTADGPQTLSVEALFAGKP